MPRPESAGRVRALVRHNTTLLLREPGPLASRMILPLVFVTLLRPLYEAAQGAREGTTQAVTGTLVTFSLLALSIAGGSVLSERVGHTWERLRTTAAHPLELLTGKAVPVLGAMLAQQVVVVGFGVLVLGMPLGHPGLLALVLLAWTGTLLALGTMAGVLVRSQGELSAAYDIGGMLLSSLGGALVPLASMPGWVRHLAPASPGYWAVSALHAALGGDAGRTAVCCAALGAFACAAGTAAAIRVGRGWGRSATL
ncbi:ABC transporter permease [Streptomyces sp. PTM05]|uniref:ABC transporter permease n=1 Tax=Streptantibioticus parmotrematis TaxID=2873249 RepID=A0ABS7QRK0_9ACTN|nr:ABC transporter permease [Streptantibioticus parmotrematis]MBY8885818.1 ABC transporter permease [Streptantibioticus parmotrematis]